MAKAKSENRDERMACPIGRVFLKIEKALRGNSKFNEHLCRSRIEFLKAMKCLIDEKIEALEKADVPRREKRATRIQVE